MKFYYLSTEPNNEGDHEIHHRECSKIPPFNKRLYLGPFNNGDEAMNLAKGSNSRSVICEACQKVSMVPKFSHFNDSEPIQTQP